MQIPRLDHDSNRNFGYPRHRSVGRKTRTVAVLPFDDLTPDGSLECFCASLTEQIMQVLLYETAANVLAQSSALQLKQDAHDIRATGRHLGVEAILEGSVRRGGNNLRISVLLAAADTGNCLWSQQYDLWFLESGTSLPEPFAAEDYVSRKIGRDMQEMFGQSPDLWIRR